jgi:hypothetical protein
MSRDDDDGADVTRDVFDIDELSLSVCRQMSGGGLLLGCPFCSEVVPLQDSGRHLLLVHRLSRLTCPGRKCPNRIQVTAYNFTRKSEVQMLKILLI